MKDDGLVLEIETQLAFQQKWRRVMSLAYFITAALGIIASAAATIVAGAGWAFAASILAGSATALFGFEKALLFREKWTHHVNSAMQLEALKIGYTHGSVDTAKAVERLSEILMNYGAKLPMAERNETTG